MKRLTYIFLVGIIFISCSQHQTKHELKGEKTHETCSDSLRDGVFIHITESYNDAHRVLMPLKMATIMCETKDVIVYMDIHAVELLVAGAEDLNFADFESAQTYLKILKEKNVGVYACPTCLKIAGFKPEDLMEGIQVAQKEKFFDFTKGRIITLDY